MMGMTEIDPTLESLDQELKNFVYIVTAAIHLSKQKQFSPDVHEHIKVMLLDLDFVSEELYAYYVSVYDRNKHLSEYKEDKNLEQ